MEILNNIQKVWVTRDGYLRQTLSADGLYEVSKDQNQPVHKGRYLLKGNKIYYNDDRGFVSTGSIESGILYQNGHTFFPEDCVKQPGALSCYL